MRRTPDLFRRLAEMNNRRSTSEADRETLGAVAALLLRLPWDVLDELQDPGHAGHRSDWKWRCITCAPTTRERREAERQEKGASR